MGQEDSVDGIALPLLQTLPSAHLSLDVTPEKPTSSIFQGSTKGDVLHGLGKLRVSHLHSTQAHQDVLLSALSRNGAVCSHRNICAYRNKCGFFRGAASRWIFVYLYAFSRLSIPSCAPPHCHKDTLPSLLSPLQVHFEQAKHRVIAPCPTSPGLVIWQLF